MRAYAQRQADGTYVERPKKIVKREATCATRSSVCTSCLKSEIRAKILK